jgi:flagellar biosynthetic protein FliQ
MTPEMVMQILRQALMAAFWVAAPLLIVAFAGGIAVSLIQILTSIQDAAFGSVPRLFLMLLGTILVLPWMINRMMSYAVSVMGDFTRYVR